MGNSQENSSAYTIESGDYNIDYTTDSAFLDAHEVNIYCDESCHLENDRQKSMSYGAIWCPKNKVQEVNSCIRQIKLENGIKNTAEVKWTKSSPSNLKLYLDLVDYFFANDDLGFRGLIVPDKGILSHADFDQTHEEWYYKMYFDMLKVIFAPKSSYYIYIDIKDTNSYENAQKLHEVCANNAYDFDHNSIRRVQPIRSEEVQIMQMVDIFTGALAYKHNSIDDPSRTNQAKHSIIKQITRHSRLSLTKTTLPQERKFNLLVWQPYKR